MKLIEITPEIVQLTRFGLVNCFLVREDDGLTLVDTMVKGSANGIYMAASSLNRSMRRILLTHVHMDHVGSLDVLSQQLNGIEVAVGRRESRFLTRDFHTEPGEAANKVRGSFSKVETIPSALLSDGEHYGSLHGGGDAGAHTRAPLLLRSALGHSDCRGCVDQRGRAASVGRWPGDVSVRELGDVAQADGHSRAHASWRRLNRRRLSWGMGCR